MNSMWKLSNSFLSNNRSIVWSRHISFSQRGRRSHSNAKTEQHKGKQKVDIAIIGGGMVGFGFTAFTSKFQGLSDKKILLLESAPDVKYEAKSAFSNRVVALSPSTKKFLTDVKAWDIIAESGRYQNVKKMQVWETKSKSSINFDLDNLSADVAYIMENNLVLHSLKSITQSLPNVHCRFNSKVESIKLSDDSSSTIKLDDGSLISCDVLIGADGFNSKVRRTAEIDTISWSHDQKSVVATLHMKDGNDNLVAWQRFLNTGPVAILPLAPTISSLVWTTTSKHADELMELSDEEFVYKLNEALWHPTAESSLVKSANQMLDSLLDSIGQRPGIWQQLPPTIEKLGPESRASFPVGFLHASNYVKPGMALIGDAAHRILPLAGQGVNLGFGDAHCLAEKINEAVMSGAAINDYQYLCEYETERQGFILPVAATIEGLQCLYSTDFVPAVAARSLGLKIMNAIPPLKKFIVYSATSGRISWPNF